MSKIKFTKTTAPDTPAANTAVLYLDQADGKFKYKNESGSALGFSGASATQPLPDYSAASTYALGDQVLYNNKLYKCTTAITTPEAWTEGKWAEIAGAGAVINDSITDGNTTSAPSENAVFDALALKASAKEPVSNYSVSADYAVGNQVYYNGVLYRCTIAIPTPEAWNASKWTKVTVNVVDNLSSTSSTDALSANQGKILNEGKAPVKAPIPEYSASATYAVGDEVIEGTRLYKCKTAITTGEAFTIGKWDLIGAIVNDSISDGNTTSAPSENAVFDALALKAPVKVPLPEYSASSTYALGDQVVYDNKLWKCTTAITVAEAWNASKWTEISATAAASGTTISQLDTNVTVSDSGSDGKVSITADTALMMEVHQLVLMPRHTK